MTNKELLKFEIPKEYQERIDEILDGEVSESDLHAKAHAALLFMHLVGECELADGMSHWVMTAAKYALRVKELEAQLVQEERAFAV